MINRIKRYLKRKKKALKKRLDFSTEGRRKRVIDNPPPIDQKSIVFTSSFDYTGNPKALFLYMIDHGYNDRYHMTWLFEHQENLFEFDIPNIDSICMFNEKHERTPEAQKAIMSARYVIYSHNVNWCKKFREGQTFIDLWHGCGYKSDKKSDKRKIYYDYLMVTGRKYIDIFKTVLRDPEGNILDLGYPRNEFLTSDRSQAEKLLTDMKDAAGADKVIMWLPTFRKSYISRLDSDTALGDTGLPVLYENKDIESIDRLCRDEKILLIVKQHFLQSDYETGSREYSNIKFLKDEFLRDHDADFYEMMGRTDAMITDYSSVAIDYMLVDKPMAYTLDDFDEYEEARGWSFENVTEYMPGHHIYTAEDLEGFIRDVAADIDLHGEWRRRIADEVHTYKDGFSRRILRYFGI